MARYPAIFNDLQRCSRGLAPAQALIESPTVDQVGTVMFMSDLLKDRTMNTGERKERRGFASMSPEKQREIASKGGRAAHQKGTAHEWTSDEARNAGRKGGQISRGGRGRLTDPIGMPSPMPTPNAPIE